MNNNRRIELISLIALYLFGIIISAMSLKEIIVHQTFIFMFPFIIGVTIGVCARIEMKKL